MLTTRTFQLTWNAMSTDFAEVLAEVSTCITASIGEAVFCNVDFATPWSCDASMSAFCTDETYLFKANMNGNTLQPTRTIGERGLRRRTKGNQKLARASKDDLRVIRGDKWWPTKVISKAELACHQPRNRARMHQPVEDTGNHWTPILGSDF